MPKPNYAFEKRQRELAKKQKKAEKAQRKETGRGPSTDGDGAAEPDTDGTTDSSADAAPALGTAPLPTEPTAGR